MQRCLLLAEKGAGSVAPNPMVGAVLVYNDRIIGEGWHQQYGAAHAEVNCLNAVEESDRKFIASSCLYVSLEPCAHFGKTPPCADLIIANQIPEVVIGCRDPFEAVNGKGIERLKNAGVKVITGVLEKECMALNIRFFTFHTKQRPYIILKWAATTDGFIARLAQEGDTDSNKRLLISSHSSNRLVHKWRSEEAAIMVGTNTALQDNPALTTRLHTGNSPIRVVLDMNLRLPASLQMFDRSIKTIVFNSSRQEEENNILFYKLNKGEDILLQVCTALYELKIQSVIVEGGTRLLQSFIDSGVWDEARVIQNELLYIENGLRAPVLATAELVQKIKIESDIISFYLHK
jgi:diaminohydroxyphosphoribosylaminopyrimidine deaminase / 5-amino-6-(5-phosphoribosylamino)uracil reductase